MFKTASFSHAVEVKDATKGEVLVRFATLGVVDFDGDIIRPGAIGRQKVLVSTYGHGTTRRGDPPVGTGQTRESGDEALADLKYFIGRTRSREEFETVADTGDLGEWSFFYEVQQASVPSEEERRLGAYRVLDKLKVVHVAPVERGAGIDTGTISAKEAALKAAADLPEVEVEPAETAAEPEAEPTAVEPAAADDEESATEEEPVAEEAQPDAPVVGLGDVAEQEEMAAVAKQLDRNATTVKAIEARIAADHAQAEAERLAVEAATKRSADMVEQKAIRAEFERFERTRARLIA